MTNTPPESPAATFATLGLAPAVLEAIIEIGYESPSPIQAEAIPQLLQGRDILGQAQTGTGKTAAFALPILSRIDLSLNRPQVLVLAPTRELAIQVAEAFQHYASKLKGFHVVPIYGGQDYRQQLRALDRGVHVVVGTPGRVMDHMRRGSLKLDALRCLVLDEADEMLRMGFIDDVEWVLEQIPSEHQTALFSATMPQQIQKISEKYLNNPALVSIKVKTTTADTVRQRFWMVSGFHKMEALTRILEVEESDGIIIFSRTKTMTVELAEKLAARGFAADALNGDIPQKMREQLVNKLKSGQLDILVATDVAARGLDVPRISHVINYDIPYDTESYVHRIGRTGRAGRKGDAILFIAPREKRMLHTIERATRQRIEPMELPTREEINNHRIARFKQKITEALGNESHLAFYREVLESYRMEHDIPSLEIAAALASLSQGDSLLPGKAREEQRGQSEKRPSERKQRESAARDEHNSAPRTAPHKQKREPKERDQPPRGYERYRVAVGSEHKIQPAQIVATIADVAGLFHEDIGTVTIHGDHSLVDLPEGMPRDIFRSLRKSWISGQRLQIERIGGGAESAQRKPRSDSGDNRGKPKSGRPDKRAAKRGKPGHKRNKAR
jgi:ATP-dependent RNA helicase DeaD